MAADSQVRATDAVQCGAVEFVDADATLIYRDGIVSGLEIASRYAPDNAEIRRELRAARETRAGLERLRRHERRLFQKQPGG